MFRRKVYQKLLDWKRVSQGKTAALIEGARRVGKSTVAEEFAKAEYKDYLLLDFTQESEAVKQNFIQNIADLDAFFRTLFLLKGKSLPKGEALIIFDEVQLFPLARQSIKTLVKDGRYHYIETGSLLSIKSNTRDILIPSEEHRIRMYPMDFEEFYWAKEDTITADSIYYAFEKKKSLGEGVHRKVMGDLRTYMVVGGMPQAVSSLIEGDTFEQIDFVKRTILSLYEDDLRKYDNEENGKVSAIYKSIPDQLSNRNKHFRFASVEKGARYSRLLNSLDFLEESMTVNICTNVTSPDIFMGMYEQKENFKMYAADTGLLVSQSMGTQSNIDDSLYKSIVVDKIDANLGMFFENIAAQMLVAKGHDLHFHEFEHRGEGSQRTNRYEVDFLMVRGKRLCPLEVKSSSYKTHKSLDYFSEKYSIKANERYVLYTKDIARDKAVTYLPIYMAMCL